MLIYVIIYCPQGQRVIIFICILICICIYINCILFCVFSCFIGVGLNLTNLRSFWLYVCVFVSKNLKLVNTY